MGDIVWLSDQNTLRGQFRLGRVISTNPDSKGIVRDVTVRVVPSYSVPVTKPARTKQRSSSSVTSKEKVQETFHHRDVRRLVVLLPAEEQMKDQANKSSQGSN